MPNIYNAQWVSVWDGGTEIITPCAYDAATNKVTEIVQTEEEIEDLDTLDSEYVLLPNGDQIAIEALASRPY